MATRERIIEGTWSCTSCDRHGIPARFKNCPSCNNPREFGKESDFDYGGVTDEGASTGETVTDEKALELANAGADWRCGYCDTANRGDKTRCRQCGAQRDEKAQVLDRGELGAPAAAPPKSSGLGRKLLIGLGSVMALLLLVTLWATRTHEVVGSVVARHWSRTVYREQFQKTAKQGWQDELRLSPSVMPVNGRGERAGVDEIFGCAQAQRGTRQVADGMERVCHDRTRQTQCGSRQECTRTKMGNGFVKESCHDVPKYCSEHYQDCGMETRYRTVPVFAMRCSYSTYDWRRVDAQTASGSGDGPNDAPRWPELTSGGNERATREEQYQVDVGYQRKGQSERYIVHPASEAEFARWPAGAKVKLTISNTGAVKSAVPAP